ncbi:hypothetical protein EJB05_42234, partial [Eragrostis curvula]
MDKSLDNNGNMGDALEDIVLSWTVSSVKDGKRMKEMPHTFCSNEEYVQCYKEPLIEETRSMILTSLNSLRTCQHYGLLGISKEKTSSFFLDIDPYCIDGVKHAARNGDIFLLSAFGPDSLPVENDGVFAMAIDISPNEYLCKSFHVITKGDVTTGEFKYAFFLCNITTNARIWKTLHHIKDNAIIGQILQPPLDNQRCDICTEEVKSSEPFDVLFNNELDRTQKGFAVRIASKIKCHHCQSLEILCGPRRSGKTRIISTVLESIISSQQNILVCAPSVHSFSSLSSYLLESMSGRAKTYDVLPAKRVGSAIILCDIEDELATSSNQIKELCIGYRLRELMPCMIWRCKIDGLISFLEGGFKEKAKEIEDKLKDKVGDRKDIMLQLLKQMLERKSSTLVTLLKTMWIYAPSHIFSEDVDKGMAALFESLDNLNSLVQNGGATEEDIRQTFNLGRVQSSKSSTLRTSIRRPSPRKNVSVNSIVVDMRLAKDECLKRLKYVARHITMFPFETDIESLKKYLIKETPVILTTPSCSFELLSLERTQIDLLIVEEASQIKECELLIPISIHSIRHVVLTGDQSRLGPISMNKVNENSGYGMSLFERLISQGSQKTLLTKQYKTHPLISYFPNNYFYKGRILNANGVSSNYLGSNLCHYGFINTDANKESAVIFSLLNIVVKAFKRKENLKLKVGVLCSWTETDIIGHMTDENANLNISIQSIHRIQEDQDFDFLIISTSAFPTDNTMIRCALSRARDYLWIVGDSTVIGKYVTWSDLIKDAKARGLFVDANKESKFPVIFEHGAFDVSNLDVLGCTLGLIACK